jgi:hypothetical protein
VVRLFIVETDDALHVHWLALLWLACGPLFIVYALAVTWFEGKALSIDDDKDMAKIRR